MEKMLKFISLCILIIFLVGCGKSQETQISEDLVATQVVIILTETALHEAQPPTETGVPTTTATQIKITESPSLTPTTTNTFTQTESPSDPAVLLGSPAWTYEFSGTSSPWDFESDQALFKTSNGTLDLTARANQNWQSWWVSSPKLRNAYVQTSIDMGTCDGYDRVGFVVRASSDGSQFYFMSLTCDGYWGFFRMKPGVEIVEIEPYQSASPLDDDWQEPHRIGIWMEGSTFRFFIDGHEVGTASDNALSGEGYTGFLIAFAETPGFTVRVDQLQYWNLP